jgi:hypothetical protein
MLCNCSFAGLFHYDLEAGAERIAQLKQELAQPNNTIPLQD